MLDEGVEELLPVISQEEVVNFIIENDLMGHDLRNVVAALPGVLLSDTDKVEDPEFETFIINIASFCCQLGEELNVEINSHNYLGYIRKLRKLFIEVRTRIYNKYPQHDLIAANYIDFFVSALLDTHGNYLELEEISLLNFMKDFDNYFQGYLRTHNIDLIVDTSTINDDLTIMGNKSVLGHLIFNIISNARKIFDSCREHDDQKICIKLVPTKNTVRIEIIDNGPGFNPDKLAEYTKLGERGDHIYVGSGKGLAFVDLLVKYLSGSLELSNWEKFDDSEELIRNPAKCGAKLTINLPLIRNESNVVSRSVNNFRVWARGLVLGQVDKV